MAYHKRPYNPNESYTNNNNNIREDISNLYYNNKWTPTQKIDAITYYVTSRLYQTESQEVFNTTYKHVVDDNLQYCNRCLGLCVKPLGCFCTSFKLFLKLFVTLIIISSLTYIFYFLVKKLK